MYGQKRTIEKFKRFMRIVRYAVRGVIRDPITAEDLVQDALVKLIEAQDKLPVNDRKLTNYVFSVGRNTAIDHLRRKASEDRYLDRAAYLDTTYSVREQHDDAYRAFVPMCTTSQANNLDLAAAIDRTIRQIPEKQREVLILYAQGRSYKEISTLQDTNIGTVRSRLFYARRTARELLTPLLN